MTPEEIRSGLIYVNLVQDRGLEIEWCSFKKNPSVDYVEIDQLIHDILVDEEFEYSLHSIDFSREEDPEYHCAGTILVRFDPVE